MREQDLKRTLGKIHPREELVEQVKDRANGSSGRTAVNPWRYAGAVAGIAVLLIAGTAGILQYNRTSIQVSPGGTEVPTQMQRAETLSQDDHPVEVVLSDNTVVCDGLTIRMLDDCSAQEQAELFSDAEEGTTCYTGNIAEIIKAYQISVEGITDGTDADGGAALVYHHGQWYGTLMEWSEEEVAAYVQTVMDGADTQ
jgi:hypothetical protein